MLGERVAERGAAAHALAAAWLGLRLGLGLGLGFGLTRLRFGSLAVASRLILSADALT